MEDDFLLELVRINSVSGNENKLVDFLDKRLKKSFKTKKQRVNKNHNLIAFKGKPKILLQAHLDTVPPFLKSRKDKKFVYGRGTNDTKGQLAAMILAGEKAIEEGINDFGLLFTVEEETSFGGAKKAVSIIPKTTKLIVIGEPTNFKIVEAHNGILDLKIKAFGKSTHGSCPEKGINAIEKIIEIIRTIKKIDYPKGRILKQNPINIAKISGGIASNVVPDYAETQIVIRTATNPKETLKKIKENTKKIKGIKIISQTLPPVISKNAKKIAKKIGLKTITFRGYTEAYYFSKKTDFIILGLNDFGTIHSKKEKASIKELKKLTKIYYKLLEEKII
ncbi:MAG: M20/M25/M40 family metallo-hydrolase [Candidatus ainarchaeum sp.]|nr:M20/M25/M40 family metallo-hydrolase [Candidatus ainarchaeum sp.]